MFIVTTGGTIDKVYFDSLSQYEIGEPTIDPIFQEAGVYFDYELCQLMRKDSLEMTEEDRSEIFEAVKRTSHRQVLITHGTDTMTITAERLVGIEDKVIVLTGAMIPARFRSTDAIFNIGCAIGALQSLNAGVYIAMNGRVFPAGEVKKNRTEVRFE